MHTHALAYTYEREQGILATGGDDRVMMVWNIDVDVPAGDRPLPPEVPKKKSKPGEAVVGACGCGCVGLGVVMHVHLCTQICWPDCKAECGDSHACSSQLQTNDTRV